MGNALNISPCFNTSSSNPSKKAIMLVFFEGTTTTLKGEHIAGEIMFQNPDKMVCDADSFFIGQPLPALSIEDQLSPGRTYFVLPIDTFSNCSVLSATSLSAFSTSNTNPNSPIKFGKECPFHYIKGQNGRVLIKVLPEFIMGLIHSRAKQLLDSYFVISNTNSVVSTPELKKHYDQLVRSKDHTWSPKLHTISEKKIRYSPCRKLLGLEC